MTETQLGSHSGMRLASAMRSKTSWMVTPTVPVYVNETGRMGDNMAVRGRQRGKGRQNDKGRQRAARDCRADAPLPPIAAFCLTAALCFFAALSVGDRGLDYQGVARRGRRF